MTEPVRSEVDVTVPSEQDRAWFHSHFLAFCARKKAFEWQAFVTDLMHARHGGQFLQVNPSGRGDKGCDGWVNGLMLACYGASNPNQKDVSDKMEEDFQKALSYWKSKMRTWAFVHNDVAGLPYMVVEGIADLRESLIPATQVDIEAWPPQVLWDYCCSELSREKLADLLGAPPSDHPAGMNYIARCVESLSRTRLPPDLDDVPVVPYGKIEHNRFGPDVAQLIIRAQEQTGHVRYYFSQASPGEQAQASLVLKALFDKYRATLRESGAVFHALCDHLVTDAFADGAYGDAGQQRSAAIMVATHFFEICEIFERPTEGVEINAPTL